MSKQLKKMTFKILDLKETDVYQAIASLFDYSSPYFYKQFVKNVCMFCANKAAYLEETPSHMLLLLNNIKQFIRIGYTLKLNAYESPIKVDNGRLYDKRFFSNTKDALKTWENRPIMLTTEEFIQPAIVFQSIFESQSHQTLFEKFKVMFECSCNDSSNNNGNINIMEAYIQLVKIIEACYLIDVREITHHHGFLKYKYHD